MRARYDYWYPGCDDYSEEDESDDDESTASNYYNFLEYQDEFPLSSTANESQYDEYDVDEFHYGRHNYNCSQQRYGNSGSRVYDTSVMRNLTIMGDDYPRGSYSPKFVPAPLEKTKSLPWWSHDDQAEGFMDYTDRKSENFVEDYYDYPQPERQQLSDILGARLQTMVENLIYSTKVVIFSKTYCPYCVVAKDIFDDMDQPYAVLELNRHADGDEIQEIMGKITGGTSVPRIFVNGMFVGGSNDVKRLYESGELLEILDFE